MEEKIFTDPVTERFLDTLALKIPGWASLGQDPAWSAWLSQKHRYSSKSRLEVLKEAYAALDAEAIVNLVKDFRLSQGLPPSTPVGSRQVAEGVTRSFIRQFSQDVIRGRYRGREKERMVIQAKIDNAIAAGKVLNG